MRTYRVIGNREVLGHQPGDVFDGDISDIQEQRLAAGGHIERCDAGDASRAPARGRKAAAKSTTDVPDDRAGEPDPEKE